VRVLAYDLPTQVVFSWDIDLTCKRELDPAKASEAMRDAVGSPDGWNAGLRGVAGAVAAT
jgi:hypothetical protein